MLHDYCVYAYCRSIPIMHFVMESNSFSRYNKEKYSNTRIVSTASISVKHTFKCPFRHTKNRVNRTFCTFCVTIVSLLCWLCYLNWILFLFQFMALLAQWLCNNYTLYTTVNNCMKERDLRYLKITKNWLSKKRIANYSFAFNVFCLFENLCSQKWFV